ncbi:MAG: YlbF family regulator [Oscillospiraceae bacterium]|nr:YlbF family regulator [Oscillospiraceae bacterium]
MTDVITLFKEAAAALQKDPRYIDLDNARTLNDKDEELQQQIGDFNLARIDLNAAVGEETRDEEKIGRLNDRVNQLYLDIMQNESMAAYNDAKTEMDALLQYINAIISAAVNGEDPMTVEEPPAGGCSGSCGSCGGCH